MKLLQFRHIFLPFPAKAERLSPQIFARPESALRCCGTLRYPTTFFIFSQAKKGAFSAYFRPFFPMHIPVFRPSFLHISARRFRRTTPCFAPNAASLFGQAHALVLPNRPTDFAHPHPVFPIHSPVVFPQTPPAPIPLLSAAFSESPLVFVQPPLFTPPRTPFSEPPHLYFSARRGGRRQKNRRNFQPKSKIGMKKGNFSPNPIDNLGKTVYTAGKYLLCPALRAQSRSIEKEERSF